MKKIFLLVLSCLMAWNIFAWEGEGTAQNPYQIATVQDLTELSVQSASNSFAGIYFQQTQNIDMSGVTFEPVGSVAFPFLGIYNDKDGAVRICQIKNLQISKPASDNVGLFAVIGSTGSVRGIIITSDSRIEGRSNVGSIAGSSSGTVSLCYSAATVVGNDDNTGGIVGQASNMENCYFMGSVENQYANNTGGIAGNLIAGSSISNSYNFGAIIGAANVGGITGYVAPTNEKTTPTKIEGCNNSGSVTATGDYAGGVAGQVAVGLTESGFISDCYNAATVRGVNYTGGIAGSSASTMGSGNEGEVIATGDNVGGVTGQGSVNSCFNRANVRGNNRVGGVVGSSGALDYCYNTGDVTGADRVGGIAGYVPGSGSGAKITNAYNAGNVSGTTNVGGVIGYKTSGGLTAAPDVKNTYWNADIYTGGRGVGNNSNATSNTGNYQWNPKTTAEMISSDFLALFTFLHEDLNGQNGGFPVFSLESNYYIMYIVRVSAGEGGTVTSDRLIDNFYLSVKDAAENVSFDITPDEGYETESILINGEMQEITATLSLSDITEDYTIEVTFKPKSESGVKNAAVSSAKVYAQANNIVVETEAGANISVLTPAGLQVFSGKAEGNPVLIPVAKGVYAVLVDGAAVKVLVR